MFALKLPIASVLALVLISNALQVSQGLGLGLCLGASKVPIVFYEHVNFESQQAIIGATDAIPPRDAGYGYTSYNKLTSTSSFTSPEIGRAGSESFVPAAGTLETTSFYYHFTSGIYAGFEIVGGGLMDTARNYSLVNDLPILGGTNSTYYAAGNQYITLVNSSSDGSIAVYKHIVAVTVYQLEAACFSLLRK